MQCLERHLSSEKGIQLSIATRVNGNRLRRANAHGTDYYLLPDSRNRLQKRLDLFLNREPIDLFLKQNLRLIEEVKPDVIEVFGTEMDYGLICSLTNIPVVIHLQGILHPYFYQLARLPIPLFDRIASQTLADYIKGSTFSNGLKIFRRRLLVEKEIFKRCKYFIGRTDWDKSITKLLAPSAKYFHCEEMIADQYFDTDWIGHPGETIHIVSTISTPFYKGHDTLLATAKVLQQADVNFTWHVIGLERNTSSFRFFYKKQVSSLLDHIKFHGRLRPEEIVDVLKQSHLYVHPSHIENSSNSLCEAMAIGMPVIALQVGGNQSIVNDGIDGILVSDNDPYRLAAIILSAARNEDQLRFLARNAKSRAAVRHNRDGITASLLTIYSSVTNANENSR